MKRSFAVLAGILIVLLVLLVWLQAAGLLDSLRWALSKPTPPIPTSTPWPYALTWQRDNDLAGRCDILRIDSQGRVLYGACRETLVPGQLTPAEQQDLDAYRARFATESSTWAVSPGGLDSQTLRLRFAGRGAEIMDDYSRAIISDWAGAVHARLTLEAQQASLVALARGHLAGRLNLAPASITLVSVESTTWPDRCLGLGSDVPCPQIPTPGMRILLAAKGESFEYRTDMLGTVLPLDTSSPPGVTPTAAVSVPTSVLSTPVPSATASPTRTSVRPSPTATFAPTATRRPSATPMPDQPRRDVWMAAYYANMDLIEPPALERQDQQISFNWGNLSPDASIPSDRFSVRWTRRIDFRRGYYQFDVQCDDGVRLWVDNALVLDHWLDGYTEHSGEAYLQGGEAFVVLEYYENQGLAEIGMTWRLTQPGPMRTPTPTVEPYYDGWRGAYYNNTFLLGEPVLIRDDSEIDFDWDDDEPDSVVPDDRFAVRWTRRMHFDEGAYRFNVSVDDGVRLWIDDRPCIDEWETGSLRDVSGYRWLAHGQHDIRLEYFEEAGDAEIHLDWSRLQAFPGFRASYYSNRHLEGDPIVVRNEDEIDHNWKEDAPLVGLPEDEFSVRWTQPVWFSSERYRFEAKVDDGIRVYLGDILLIDEWHDGDSEDYDRVIDLVAGTYDLRVEYYENGGNARCSVEWSIEE